MRQILELIIQDKREQLKFQAQLVEWQTKNVCAMFTVAAREPKQAREIAKAVKKMNLPLGDEADVNSKRVLDVVDDELQPSMYDELDESAAEFMNLDDQPGFEDLMGAFGSAFDMDTNTV